MKPDSPTPEAAKAVIDLADAVEAAKRRIDALVSEVSAATTRQDATDAAFRMVGLAEYQINHISRLARAASRGVAKEDAHA